MLSSSDPRFLRPHTDAYIKRLSDAIRNTEHATVTEEEADHIASMILTPSNQLIHRGAIAPVCLQLVRNRFNQRLLFMKAQTMPALPNPSNPRIEPDMRLEYRGHGVPRPMTPNGATHIEFAYPSDTAMLEHFDRANTALRNRVTVQKRGYDLTADMSFRGQMEPGTVALTEVVFTQAGETFRQPRLATVLGANRATASFDLLGINARDLLFANADLRKFWAAHLSMLQRIADIGDPSVTPLDHYPEAQMRAMAEKLREYGLEAALKNLNAPNWILIGAPDTQGDLVGELDALNLDSHLHPPAAFDDDAKGLALFSAIVQRVVAEGFRTREQGQALLGYTEPQAGGYGDLSEMRFDMARILLPLRHTEDRQRQIIRELLAEPVGTATNTDHATARSRIFGAAYFGGGENPRVANKLFSYHDTRDGLNIPWKNMSELLAAAPADPEAASFLMRLGPLMLAEVNCYEAPRGSNPLRREPDNLKGAFARNPQLAIAVLAAAANTAPGAPVVLTQPDGTTVVIDDLWVYNNFPKSASAAPRIAPTPTPVAPPDPTAQFLHKQDAAITAADAALNGVKNFIEAAEAVLEHARGHGFTVPERYANELAAAYDDAVIAITREAAPTVSETRQATQPVAGDDADVADEEYDESSDASLAEEELEVGE